MSQYRQDHQDSELSQLLRHCVFKYGPRQHIETTLRNETIGFSSLFEVNDAYEHEYYIEHYFNSKEEQRALLTTGGGLFVHQRSFIDEYLKSIKVSCFALAPDISLMWSYYAEDHKGVVYCFRRSKMLGMDFPWGNVMYSSVVPRVKIFQDKTTEGMLRAQLEDVVLTKSVDWAHEREIRFYRRQEETSLPFDPSSLAAVIIGRRIDAESRRLVKNEVKAFNDRHGTSVRILFARRWDGSYMLGIDENENFQRDSESASGAALPVRPDIDTPLVTKEYLKPEDAQDDIAN